MNFHKSTILPPALWNLLPQDVAEVFPQLLDLAVAAGNTILPFYGTELNVVLKDDESPVTPADEAAHVLIAKGLERLLPHLPVLSEEGLVPPAEERADWDGYFLVDPLDGTKGFINRNGQFTVNIAYMERNVPVAGIIHVPLQGTTYFGIVQGGAFRCEGTMRDAVQPIRTNRTISAMGPVVLQSNVDRTPRLDVFMGERQHTRIRAGSSLKFCLLAEGSAHLFPCLHPTWEWDTAAGQAILEAAGGSLSGLEGEPFVYGKPSLLNDWFVAKA